MIKKLSFDKIVARLDATVADLLKLEQQEIARAEKYTVHIDHLLTLRSEADTEALKAGTLADAVSGIKR